MTVRSSNQEKLFHTVLDIINNEKKAFVFLHFVENNFRSINDLKDTINKTINRYPALDVNQIIDNNIYRYIKTVLSKSERQLLIESNIPGFRRKRVMAWKLTRIGKHLQPLVAFAIPFLPINYNLSAGQVLFRMSSPCQRRPTYSKISILEYLKDGVKSMKQITEHLRVGIDNTSKKMNFLSSIDNGQTKLPFVEEISGFEYLVPCVLSWTGKHLDRNDFQKSVSRSIELVKLLSSIGSDRQFLSTDLFKLTSHPSKGSFWMTVKNLIKLDYIKKEKASEVKQYKISRIGLHYLEGCIEPIKGYLEGNRTSIEYISSHQPSDEQLVYSLAVYQKLKRYG